MGRSVADFCGEFSGTRWRSIASRRVPENSPQKSATEPPLYMCVLSCRDFSKCGLSPLMSCFSRKPQSALRDDCWELNEQRLEEGYFWWSLVNFYEEVSLLHCTNLFCARSKESCRRDIEQLCEKAWVHV